MGYIIYIVAGIEWGIFSALMQKKVHPDAAKWKTSLSFFLNMCGWPIGMSIAIYNLKFKPMENNEYNNY